MERLTEKCWRNLDQDLGGGTGGCIVPKVYARLAAYEDTGLTPEEISALIPPPNAPLTLEELREMDLMDWVWVEILKPSRFRRTKSGYYCKFDDYTSGEAFCCGWPGTILH